MEVRRAISAMPGSTEKNDESGTAQFRTYRNGLPEMVRYTYRGRIYPWAQRALAAAEAEHGRPVPVCQRCGGPLRTAGGYGKCAGSCGPLGRRARANRGR